MRTVPNLCCFKLLAEVSEVLGVLRASVVSPAISLLQARRNAHRGLNPAVSSPSCWARHSGIDGMTLSPADEAASRCKQPAAGIATALGISQPAVSQQLRAASNLSGVHPGALVEAAARVLRRLAEDAGYGRLAAFGSVARGEAGQDSDIDLLVRRRKGRRHSRSSSSSS